jgi:rubredoxin
MEIRHRVAFNGDKKPDFKTTIDRLDVKYKMSPLPGHTTGLISFDITESDSRWAQIEELIREKGASDIFVTVFSREEILETEWVRLVATFERGYPQPEGKWKQLAYQNECSECGAGYRQKAAFRLKKEPRMSRHSFLSLYWTHSVFCIPQVVEALQAHQIQGYDEWKAIIHKADRPSEVVTQLVFPIIAQPGLAEEDKLQPETCPQCGIIKYAYHKRGYMHLKREALQSDTDFLLTHEWFGSGGYGGFREILISNRVANLILEESWRGVTLKPVKLF